MIEERTDPLRYYARPGLMTDPGPYAGMFAGLPSGIAELCQVVQTNLVHVFWAERYGLKLAPEQEAALQLRAVSAKLACMQEQDSRPLVEPRPLEQRQVGNCRDFSTLLTAMLRHQGIPARARCGFGTYFLPDHYEDHWMVEYWHAGEERWVAVDPQLDELQRQVLGIDFDTLDLPPGKFVIAGQAWQMCRQGQADPEKFGIFQWHGMNFIRGNVVRDLLALNKIEILPWDFGWGLMAEDAPAGSAEDNALFDRISALTLQGNDTFGAVRELYEGDERLHIPPAWVQPQ